MKYVIKNDEIALKYQNKYLEARKNKKEKYCFIGIGKGYKMTIRDSYYDNITDMEVLLEWCLYPLYLKGYTEIKDEVQKIVEEMVNSNDVLQIFQVFNLIMSQEIEMSLYFNIPFQIDFSKIAGILLQKKNELQEQIKNYRKNGFERFKNAVIWKSIENICESSKVLKGYISK